MPILAKFEPLITDCQLITTGFLQSMMGRMFDNSDAALLDFAEKAESNIAQSRFFEAMNEIRRKRVQFEASFYHEVNQSFASFIHSGIHETQQDLSPFKTMSLVAEEEQEEEIAIKNALAKLARDIHEEVFALRQRLAVINDCVPVAEKNIPGGPYAIADAFKTSIHLLEIDTKVRLVILALFDKFVLSQATIIFSEINNKLLSAGILPNLKYEIKKNKNTYTNPVRNRQNNSNSKEPVMNRAALGEELFSTICQLLAKRTENTQAENQSIELFPDIDSAVLKPVLYDSIGKVQKETLQRKEPDRAPAADKLQKNGSNALIENIEIDETLINVLQQTIIAEKEKIFGGIDRRKIPTADANSIELVGMIFEYMLKEDELSSIAKAALSRLHTPFLKLSIVDRSFFTQTEHPARILLNMMICAGIQWINTDKLDAGIYPEITRIVENILCEFDNDISIFERHKDELQSTISRLEEKASILEKRTNEAATGQEKLLSARNRSQREVQSLIAGKNIAKPAYDLLHKLWADKLTFMLLRDESADTSAAWTTARTLASEIILSTQLPCDENDRQHRKTTITALHQDIRKELKTVHHIEKEALLQSLFIYHKKILEPASKAVIEEIVKNNPVSTTRNKRHNTLNEKEQDALNRIEKLPFGTWFDFHDKASGKIQRAKLSWHSPITEKFMFVDIMGLKAAVIAKPDLARGFVDGSVQIITQSNTPFVDRALSAVYKSLEKDMAAAV